MVFSCNFSQSVAFLFHKHVFCTYFLHFLFSFFANFIFIILQLFFQLTFFFFFVNCWQAPSSLQRYLAISLPCRIRWPAQFSQGLTLNFRSLVCLFLLVMSPHTVAKTVSQTTINLRQGQSLFLVWLYQEISTKL